MESTVTERVDRRISINEPPDVVALIEEEFPILTSEFRKIQDEQYRIFCAKHHDYGLHNIDMGEDVTTEKGRVIPLVGLMVRMRDKTERIKNLLSRSVTHLGPTLSPANESLEDTFGDVSNYGIIALLVKRGLWKRG